MFYRLYVQYFVFNVLHSRRGVFECFLNLHVQCFLCNVLHSSRSVFECFKNLYVQCFKCNVLHSHRGVFECFINLYGRVLFPWLAPRAPFIAHRRGTCADHSALSSSWHRYLLNQWESYRQQTCKVVFKDLNLIAWYWRLQENVKLLHA